MTWQPTGFDGVVPSGTPDKSARPSPSGTTNFTPLGWTPDGAVRAGYAAIAFGGIGFCDDCAFGDGIICVRALSDLDGDAAIQETNVAFTGQMVMGCGATEY